MSRLVHAPASKKKSKCPPTTLQSRVDGCCRHFTSEHMYLLREDHKILFDQNNVQQAMPPGYLPTNHNGITDADRAEMEAQIRQQQSAKRANHHSLGTERPNKKQRL